MTGIPIQPPPLKVYLYGRPQAKGHSDEYNKSHLVVYVSPTIFTDVPLSSLEGVFVQNSDGNRETDLDWFLPQIHFLPQQI